jgi:hypothetical protein
MAITRKKLKPTVKIYNFQVLNCPLKPFTDGQLVIFVN